MSVSVVDTGWSGCQQHAGNYKLHLLTRSTKTTPKKTSGQEEATKSKSDCRDNPLIPFTNSKRKL